MYIIHYIRTKYFIFFDETRQNIPDFGDHKKAIKVI